MIVRDVKKHVCAMTGDTTGRSRLYVDFATDYINWTTQAIFERLRKEGKSYPFFFGTATIDTTVEGTGGDYLLPLDFRELTDASATTSTILVFVEYDFVNITDFQRISRASLSDRQVVTVYYDNTTRRWRIQFYAHSIISPLVYTIQYKKGPARVVDDADEIPLFPTDEGWDQILVYGVAKHAYRFHQEDFNFDPGPEFEKLLDERIETMNTDTPDESVTIPMSEHDKFYKHLEMDRYGEGGGWRGGY